MVFLQLWSLSSCSLLAELVAGPGPLLHLAHGRLLYSGGGGGAALWAVEDALDGHTDTAGAHRSLQLGEASTSTRVAEAKLLDADSIFAMSWDSQHLLWTC